MTAHKEKQQCKLHMLLKAKSTEEQKRTPVGMLVMFKQLPLHLNTHDALNELNEREKSPYYPAHIMALNTIAYSSAVYILFF